MGLQPHVQILFIGNLKVFFPEGNIFSHRWRIMFAIPAVIYVAVAVLFVIFASGEVQEFDKKVYKKKYCFLL